VHRRHVDGEGCVTPGTIPVVVVPLARLVPLRFNVVGQVRALSLLGCPTVPPVGASRPCERSGHQYAPVARTRVIQFLSLHEKEDQKVGQWGDAPNSGALRRPTSILKGGTNGTTQQQQIAEVVYSPALPRRSPCVTHIFTGWH
jgi:hypothetical protein